MSTVVIVAIFGLAALAGVYTASQFEQELMPVWNPTLALWQILRLLTIVAIAYALWMTGRSSAKAIALLGAFFLGLYLWLEKPYKDL